jgi:predicted Zn-dependent protease
VKPDRISIARVTQATTLAEFNRRYPSTIEIDKLALINGLADGGAELEPGDWVKRVVAQ